MKSGYKVALASPFIPSCSGLDSMESWWKYLWKISIPPKVKLFIWRAAFNWILSFFNLSSRGADVSKWCPFCKRGFETTFHAMWGCPLLKNVHKVSAA
ncbi:hypothetical protein ACOSQ2_007244 [Xanthoceras sorbifolium]